jgi:hypothetical protein
MKKFKFTKGILKRLDYDYWDLVLYSKDKVIYKATLPNLEACKMVEKYNNIVILKD